MKTTKTFEKIEQAVVALQFKANKNMYKIVRTKSGRWGFRSVNLK